MQYRLCKGFPFIMWLRLLKSETLSKICAKWTNWDGANGTSPSKRKIDNTKVIEKSSLL